VLRPQVSSLLTPRRKAGCRLFGRSFKYPDAITGFSNTRALMPDERLYIRWQRLFEGFLEMFFRRILNAVTFGDEGFIASGGHVTADLIPVQP